MIKPSIPTGFLELIPEKQIIFDAMKKIIEETYIKYGFLSLDTPVIEKSEILLAKGGGETAKQVYRFNKGSADLSLRFDLTVPLARYVSMHYNDLNFPFRRYQIGKVYRGEKAQKGRFREFYQCDVDVIGNNKLSVRNDGELPAIIYEIFKKFGFEEFVFNINNRKILKGFFSYLGIEDSQNILRIIDKLDKIGIDKVKLELLEEGLEDNVISKLLDFINIDGDNEKIIEKLENYECDNDEFIKGVEDLGIVYETILNYNIPKEYIKINLKIARGLDYYTGTVYETFLTGYESIGSVCSGGAYDDLASNYSNQKMPGVGISIGLTRLYFQLMEADLLRINIKNNIKLLVIPMEEYVDFGIKLTNQLREKNIICQIYFESGKFAKKFAYADKLGVKWTVVIGEDEANNNNYKLKNMETGDQISVTFEQLLDIIK